MKIILTGGGTGGHIYPIVAVIRELRQTYGEAVSFSYVGPKDNFCRVVLGKERVKVYNILSGKIRRYLDPLVVVQNAIDVVIKIPIGILQAFFWLFVINPKLVYSKGGYGSYPVAVSAWILGIPVLLQESDAVPGLASKKTAKYAKRIFVSFPKTEGLPATKTTLVGNPVRREMSTGSRQNAIAEFGLKGGRPLILVLGGSQGAQRINDKILDSMPELLKNYEIIHQAGPRNIGQVTKESKITAPPELLNYYHPIGFADEKTMADAYAAADLIISRAGSGIIFEIAAAKKPSILIPLPESAQDHQVQNAYIYAQAGAALVIEENNFTSHLFLEKIHDLIVSPETLAAMAEAAAQFARPDAAKNIAGVIAGYLNRR